MSFICRQVKAALAADNGIRGCAKILAIVGR
jgi:hypothetical protein